MQVGHGVHTLMEVAVPLLQMLLHLVQERQAHLEIMDVGTVEVLAEVLVPAILGV